MACYETIKLLDTEIIASTDSMKMALEQMGLRVQSMSANRIETGSHVFTRSNKDAAWQVQGSINTQTLKIQLGRAKVFEVAKKQGYMVIREQDEQGRIVIRLRGK